MAESDLARRSRAWALRKGLLAPGDLPVTRLGREGEPLAPPTQFGRLAANPFILNGRAGPDEPVFVPAIERGDKDPDSFRVVQDWDKRQLLHSKHFDARCKQHPLACTCGDPVYAMADDVGYAGPKEDIRIHDEDDDIPDWELWPDDDDEDWTPVRRRKYGHANLRRKSPAWLQAEFRRLIGYRGALVPHAVLPLLRQCRSRRARLARRVYDALGCVMAERVSGEVT